jgi:hypothetical protein
LKLQSITQIKQIFSYIKINTVFYAKKKKLIPLIEKGNWFFFHIYCFSWEKMFYQMESFLAIFYCKIANEFLIWKSFIFPFSCHFYLLRWILFNFKELGVYGNYSVDNLFRFIPGSNFSVGFHHIKKMKIYKKSSSISTRQYSNSWCNIFFIKMYNISKIFHSNKFRSAVNNFDDLNFFIFKIWWKKIYLKFSSFFTDQLV